MQEHNVKEKPLLWLLVASPFRNTDIKTCYPASCQWGRMHCKYWACGDNCGTRRVVAMVPDVPKPEMEQPAKVANLDESIGSSSRECERCANSLRCPAEKKCMEKLATAANRQVGIRRQDGDNVEAAKWKGVVPMPDTALDLCLDMPVIAPSTEDQPLSSMVEAVGATTMVETAGNVAPSTWNKVCIYRHRRFATVIVWTNVVYYLLG